MNVEKYCLSINFIGTVFIHIQYIEYKLILLDYIKMTEKNYILTNKKGSADYIFIFTDNLKINFLYGKKIYITIT